MTTVCVFEDDGWRGLLPFTWLHPCWDLVTGTHTILSRVKEAFPDSQIQALCRPWMQTVVQERGGLPILTGGGQTLFVNGRIVDACPVVRLAREIPGPFALWCGDAVAAFRIDDVPPRLPFPDHVTDWVRGLDLPGMSSDARLFRRWWDLLSHSGDILAEDLRQRPLGIYEGTIMPGVHLLDPARVYVGPAAVVDPGVVIDSRQGAVVIERGARIGTGSLISGPAFLARDTLVKPLSQIGPDVSIGPSCRVGGEVARTVFLGYGNKQHHGFLGHAYVGNWTNLGAGTTNSNLKNTYGHVKVWADGRMEDSGLTFLGCAIGDHAKTAINTTLNTGTVIGTSANVFSRGFPPKFVPSFGWGPAPNQEFDLRSALLTAARVMERRGIEFTPAEAALMTEVWDRTIPERHAGEGGGAE
ncbi:MAG: hypothetical protein MUE60_09615 [Candidatus Eisenbacteria bacterium]|jgi:UDP-N-acetylglucosamine diphosphorylase/glucosamine-1-phosphate N-acetyltransferase|nr:hypothetical protein [Candidatus Eisenbacteria bacterium]